MKAAISFGREEEDDGQRGKYVRKEEFGIRSERKLCEKEFVTPIRALGSERNFLKIEFVTRIRALGSERKGRGRTNRPPGFSNACNACHTHLLFPSHPYFVR